MRIGLVGSSGRMGQEILKLSLEFDHQCVGFWDSNGPRMLDGSKNWKSYAMDVVIDFSLPKNFNEVLIWCQKNKIPLVSGVTGLGEVNLKKIYEILGQDKELSAPVFWSSNMSLGIASIKEAIHSFKSFKPENIEISEVHHVQKKDSPSGTAITLAEMLKKNLDYKKDIEIKAERVVDVFGVHTIKMSNEDELIEIKHEAKNRKVFARGSLRVAEWLIHQEVDRFYKMGDYISATES